MISTRQAVLIAVAATLLLLVIFDSAAVVRQSRILMGTVVEIEVPLGRGINAAKAQRAIDKAFSEIIRIDSIFSAYRSDSEISAINRRSKQEPLRISPEAYDLIRRSLDYSSKTAGAFDISVKPLADLWRDAKEAATTPPEDEVAEARSRVGSSRVLLDARFGTIEFERDGMGLDPGGVAKGYAVDRAVATLKVEGIANARVRAGGDSYCLGRRSRFTKWKVGVRHPRRRGKLVFDLRLENAAVSTSGGYEKFFIVAGRRYSHIIDPATGYPVGDAVLSATVIAKDSETADMLATALCILGEKGFFAGLDARAEAAILAERDGIPTTVATDGFTAK